MIMLLFHTYKVCRESSLVTHSHPSGVCYATLQAAAVKMALQTEMGTIDHTAFIEGLTAFIQPHEPSDQLDKEPPADKR